MIGPAIPDALLKKKAANDDEIVISMSDEEEAEVLGPQIPAPLLEKKRQQDIGPQIPQAGPQIPQHILEQKATSSKNTDEISISHEDFVGPQIPTTTSAPAGPQIPAHILQQRFLKVQNTVAPVVESEEEVDPDAFAPELPPDLIEQKQKQQPQPIGRRRRPVGPSFPTGPMPPQDDDDYIVGPALPADYNPDEDAKYSAIHAIEQRARQTQESMEKKNEVSGKVERPEWMLVPPEVDYLKKANSSKSRQFTNKTMSKEELDSTEWTLTPAQKQQRLEEQRSGKRKTTEEEIDFSQLDRERIRNVQEYNMQTRPLTLLELHQQKKKKTKDYTVEDVTKRAFDREKDLLGGKKMDRKTKKEMLRQSAQLGEKFGYGKTSFL
ncbi:unnamed protein product [Mucor hiemalis]